MVINVTVTAGTLVFNAGRASRYSQFPLEKREADKIRVYQTSSATMSNMSSVVPFVMTPSGRFGDKACGPLLTMANRAFGADRRPLAHYLAEPPGRNRCPGCSSAAEEADQHADAAVCGCAGATRRGE